MCRTMNCATRGLNSNQAAEKEEFEEKQRALEAVVTPVLQNLSSGRAEARAGQGGGGTVVQAEADEIEVVA
jgi:hypothetical protein